MRRLMLCFSVGEDGFRMLTGSLFAEEILGDAADRWPTGEIQLRNPVAYFLLPGPWEELIPLGAAAREAEASLRRLLDRKLTPPSTA